MARVALLALVTLASCTTAPGLGRDTSAIIGGTTDSGDPAIVLWVAQVPGSQFATVCTAALISPHVALTAAHCAAPDIVGPNAKFSLYPGLDVDQAKASDFIPLVETHFDADFDAMRVMNGGDIAVGILENPLGPTPIPMNRHAITDDLIGQSARLVGYGKSAGDDSTGATVGTKRQVTSQLDSYTDKLVRLGAPGATTCEGDSGGPALMTLDDVETIVGVVSFGDTACAQLGVDTRVDFYADSFVTPFIEAADPGDPASMPVQSGCEMTPSATPPSLPLVLALCAFGYLERRNRTASAPAAQNG